jgi:hypothetical protein
LRWGKTKGILSRSSSSSPGRQDPRNWFQIKKVYAQCIECIRTRTLNRFNNWKGWKHFSFSFFFLLHILITFPNVGWDGTRDNIEKVIIRQRAAKQVEKLSPV